MNKRALFALSTTAVVLPAGLVTAYLGSAAPHAAAQTAPAPRAASPAATLPASVDASAISDAANAFLATLSQQQRTAVQIEMTPRNAAQWSNLPVTFVPRNGVFLRDLNAAQTAAALKVARLALSAEGFKRLQEIGAADDLLHKSDHGPGGFDGPPPGGPGGPGGGLEYGAGDYAIAFLGKPSKTTPWLLQIGGHHLAFNLFYKGRVGTATPYFLGVEPATWKDAGGNSHAPLAPMRDAVYGLVHSLTPEQLTQARLDARFSDVYVGPGRDGQFPAREGVPVSGLSAASKALVKQAITAWTGDTAQGAAYQKLYFAELDGTKVAYSGTTTLNNQGDYVRIDGPHVWIEFACQNGIVFRDRIHYHTIWRDRVTDYGTELSF